MSPFILYISTISWGCILLAAFGGWGYLLNRQIGIRAGWGIDAATGMALVCILGALLLSVSLAGPLGLGLLVVCGVAGAMLRYREQPPQLPKDWKALIWVFPALAFLSAPFWNLELDINDDFLSYMAFPIKILQTGTLFEPFNFQRAGTLGGHALLQALTMLVSPHVSTHFIEKGLSFVIWFAIMWSLVAKTSNRSNRELPLTLLLIWITLFAVIIVPVPRISSNSALTGGVMLLTLFWLLPRIQQRNSVVLAGVLLAGLLVIKTPFGIVGAIMWVAAAAGNYYHNREKSTVINTIGALGLAGVLALPGMLLLRQSNGALLIPPWAGNVSELYKVFNFQNPTLDIFSGLAYFLNAEVFLIILVGVVLAVNYPRMDRAQLAGLLGIWLGCLLLLYKFSALAYLDQYRYLFPMMTPPILWLALKSVTEHRLPPPYMHALGVTLIIYLAIGWASGTQLLQTQVRQIGTQLLTAGPKLDKVEAQKYLQVQYLVPKSLPIVAAVDDAFVLNYARNPIYNLNFVGASSPPPHLQLFGEEKMTLEQFIEYFRKLNIQYLMCMDFDHARLLYNRKLWTTHTRPEWFYQVLWKPQFQHFMALVDQLEEEGNMINKKGNVRLFKLY